MSMKMSLNLILILLVAVCGCSGAGNGAAGNGASAAKTSADTHDDHDHAHPSAGPHHGTLVELGQEEYHAEVVHTADAVTVYVLDAHAEKSVSIDATEVTINVLHDGKPEQFKLVAKPDANDGAGKSSCFALTDADLASHMDDHVAVPKLSLTINGKAYRGEIHHAH